MSTLFVRHTVADCAAWRRIFDDFAPTQKALGVTDKAVSASPTRRTYARIVACSRRASSAIL